MPHSEGQFERSPVYKSGGQQYEDTRTSVSAWLAKDSAAKDCVLARARSFMGSMLATDGEFGVPQLVKYQAGQKFDYHTDWIAKEQYDQVKGKDGKVVTKRWNRIASFFVFIRARCEGGETHFPLVNGTGLLNPGIAESNAKIRRHEEAGLAFKPIEGNALFWVNLRPDGSGDRRLVHAGLPVESGWKVGMNLWPRFYFND